MVACKPVLFAVTKFVALLYDKNSNIWHKRLSDSFFQKGANVIFDCGVEVDKELITASTITWTKYSPDGHPVQLDYVSESTIDDQTFDEENEEEKIANHLVVLSNNSLKINNVTEEDVGTYRWDSMFVLEYNIDNVLICLGVL